VFNHQRRKNSASIRFGFTSRNAIWRVLTLVAAGMIIAVHAHATEVVDLQLRWHHQFQFAGYYAAVEKGFYKEEGLDVLIHAGDPAHQPVPEVLAGHAHYAEGNSEVLYQRLLGKPLVALAAIFQHSPSVLLTRRDSGIESVHDLMGKKVMLMNMTEDADFLSMFLSEDISLSQVQIMPSSYDINDLISGKVDAFNSYTTNEPYLLKQRNIAYNIIDPSTYRIDFYSDILFTSEAELRDHPKRVEAMRRATLKGWRYAMDHPDEIITLLLDKYHVEKTREHLEFEAAEMRKLIFPNLIEIGHMNPGRWQHMADSFVNAGLIKPGYKLDGFIYDPSPKQAPAWVFPLLIAVLIILTVVSAITYYLQRLNRRLTKTQIILRDSEERLRLALGAASQGWFDINIQTGAVSVSPEYAKILGYEPDEFTSNLQVWETGIHPDDRPLVMATYHKRLADGEPIAMEYRRQKKNGEWVWIRSIGKFTAWTPEHQPLRMSGIHTDITVQKMVEFELVRQAHTDHLTGFNNRGHFMQQAELELRRAVRYGAALSIFMMDVDHFKKINDTYGHKVGDLVLQKLAAVSRDTLRMVDIIGRVGGEEFAILLPETAEQEAIRVAERLRQAIANAKVPLGHGLPLSITVSIGITSLMSKDDNIDVLLNFADKALYEAKNAGRNRIFNIQAIAGTSA
jgi:diguanylate cyclase (GGDEF)-like protein/PAS domain S-box-containing protein